MKLWKEMEKQKTSLEKDENIKEKREGKRKDESTWDNKRSRWEKGNWGAETNIRDKIRWKEEIGWSKNWSKEKSWEKDDNRMCDKKWRKGNQLWDKKRKGREETRGAETRQIVYEKEKPNKMRQVEKRDKMRHKKERKNDKMRQELKKR